MDTNTIFNTRTRYYYYPSSPRVPTALAFLLHKEDIHIWIVKLDNLKNPEKENALLSAFERMNAERLIGADKRGQYTATHIALRKILSCYTGISAGQILFNYSENGKPFISSLHEDTNINFNLSHSGYMMILAVTKGSSVGIDIEKINAISNFEWVADNYLSSSDAETLKNLGQSSRTVAFYRLWTLKEAQSKCSGLGFSQAPEISFSELNNKQGWESCDLINFRASGYWYSSFMLSSNYITGLAAQTDKEPNIEFFDYRQINAFYRHAV